MADMPLPKLPGVRFESVPMPALDWALSAYYVISSCEASSNLARYDGVRYGHRAKAETLAEMYLSSRSEGFGPEVKRRIMLGSYCLSAGHYDRYYHKAQKARQMIRAEFDRLFEGYDALLCPVSPVAPWPLGQNISPVERYRSDLYTVPASLAGLPALAVGNVQFIGPAHSEALLYQLGAAAQEAGAC